MVTECIAVYQADLDMVQVSAVMQEDDGSTLHDRILEASIKLLFNDNEIIVKSIEAIDYNVEEKSFYVFFINPPLKRFVTIFILSIKQWTGPPVIKIFFIVVTPYY